MNNYKNHSVGPGALAGAAAPLATDARAAGAPACRNILLTQNSHLTTRLKSAATLLLSVLHEIFDESAYRRFLQRNRLAPSRASYAAFLRDHAHARPDRPRCC